MRLILLQPDGLPVRVSLDELKGAAWDPARERYRLVAVMSEIPFRVTLDIDREGFLREIAALDRVEESEGRIAQEKLMEHIELFAALNNSNSRDMLRRRTN